MPILFIVDNRLRIHRSGLHGRLDQDLQGKDLYDLVEEKGCGKIDEWWKEHPYSPIRISAEPLPEFKGIFGNSHEWLITPLISTSGSVDFAVIEASLPEFGEQPQAEAHESKTVQAPDAEMEEQLETIQSELELLYDVALIVSASLDPKETLDKLANRLVEHGNCNYTAFYSLADDILIRYSYAGKEVDENVESIPLGEGPIGQAGYEGTPCVITADDDVEWTPSVPGSNSLLAVPIVTKAMVDGEETESVSGVIVIESSRSDAFNEEDIRRISLIAGSVAMAIENARLLEQTVSLLHKESSQRQEISRRKSELDEFVHTISHDLRNPLNNISGFAELLALEVEKIGDAQVQKYVDRIDANAAVISRMIGDLLELSRVGRVDDQHEALDMDQLLREIKYDFTMSHEDSELELNVFNMPSMLVGSRRRLHQLFSNLIGNAVKYCHPDRPPRVTVTCVEEDDCYRFSVSDNGIGIDEESQASIFVFGVRVREKDVEGTGAGLAISKKIVESHNGRIWVESEKDEGSTFYFTLPKTSVS